MSKSDSDVITLSPLSKKTCHIIFEPTVFLAIHFPVVLRQLHIFQVEYLVPFRLSDLIVQFNTLGLILPPS